MSFKDRHPEAVTCAQCGGLHPPTQDHCHHCYEPDDGRRIPVLIYRVTRMNPRLFTAEFDKAITDLGASDFTFIKLTPEELARLEEAEGYTCEHCGANITPGDEKTVGDIQLCPACHAAVDPCKLCTKSGDERIRLGACDACTDNPLNQGREDRGLDERFEPEI